MFELQHVALTNAVHTSMMETHDLTLSSKIGMFYGTSYDAFLCVVYIRSNG